MGKVEPQRGRVDARGGFNKLGWQEAADIITYALAKTIKEKKVTYDLARLMKNITPIKTSEYAAAIIANM